MFNYYQILGAKDFASTDEVRTAYRTKCKEYHPDRLVGLGDKLARLARNEMLLINRAYEVLSDSTRRGEFDAWLGMARHDGRLSACLVCGIAHEPENADIPDTVCPVCRRVAAESDPADSGSGLFDPLRLLECCFVVLHHFVSASSVQKFHPTVAIIAGGEELIVSGSPGPLEIVINNRRLYDLIVAGAGVFKHPWNHALYAGKVSFGARHPVEAAGRLWSFCRRIVHEPSLDYCNIRLNDKKYEPYEHLLNRTTLFLVCGLSPWTASKLYKRHRCNLAAAATDPEARIPEPFYEVMTAGRDRAAMARTGEMAEAMAALREQIAEMRSAETLATRNLETRDAQIAAMRNEISALALLQHDVIKKEKTIEELKFHIGLLENQNRKFLEQIAELREKQSRESALQSTVIRGKDMLLDRLQKRVAGLESQIEDGERRQELVFELKGYIRQLELANTALSGRTSFFDDLTERLREARRSLTDAADATISNFLDDVIRAMESGEIARLLDVKKKRAAGRKSTPKAELEAAPEKKPAPARAADAPKKRGRPPLKRHADIEFADRAK